MIEFEVGAGEGLVLALRLIQNGDMRFDPFLMDEPTEGFGIATCAVPDETLGVNAELLLNTINHIECCGYFSLADWRRSLNINDDGVIEIDEEDRFARRSYWSSTRRSSKPSLRQ